MAPIGKIEVDVTVEIGRAQLSLQKLLGLGRGAIVMLGCDAAQPLKILANGLHLADARVILEGEKVHAAVLTPIRAGK